jgi:hypothetical protein
MRQTITVSYRMRSSISNPLPNGYSRGVSLQSTLL